MSYSKLQKLARTRIRTWSRTLIKRLHNLCAIRAWRTVHGLEPATLSGTCFQDKLLSNSLTVHMAAQIGIEPTTYPLTAGSSTVELLCNIFRERLERSTSFL